MVRCTIAAAQQGKPLSAPAADVLAFRRTAMNFQSVVSDLKSRMDTLASQGQEVVKVLPGTLKQVNEVVMNGFESLMKSETTTAKDLFESAKAGFEKARVDGLKAVVSSPIEYLPPKDKLVAVISETVEIFSRTGDELYQTVKTNLAQSPAKKRVASGARKAKRTVKKAAAPVTKRATRTARKASAKVEKAADHVAS
jgi:hypothetical protein